jgi:hypothetical protein
LVPQTLNRIEVCRGSIHSSEFGGRYCLRLGRDETLCLNGKSLDESSSIQEQVYPYNHREEYAPSAFDVKHNFVVSYNYELPFAKLSGKANRLTDGWALSGITRFATGLPVTFASFGDNAQVYVQNNGVNSVSTDLPNYTPGNLQINHNRRNGLPYFNTSLFTANALGTQGNGNGDDTGRGGAPIRQR